MKKQRKKWDADLSTQLNDLLDIAYTEALHRKLDNTKLAIASNLCYATVYRLGARITRYPRWQTVASICKAVGVEMKVVSFRDPKAIAGRVGA